jgi:hypothetical protein
VKVTQEEAVRRIKRLQHRYLGANNTLRDDVSDEAADKYLKRVKVLLTRLEATDDERDELAYLVGDYPG